MDHSKGNQRMTIFAVMSKYHINAADRKAEILYIKSGMSMIYLFVRTTEIHKKDLSHCQTRETRGAVLHGNSAENKCQILE